MRSVKHTHSPSFSGSSVLGEDGTVIEVVQGGLDGGWVINSLLHPLTHTHTHMLPLPTHTHTHTSYTPYTPYTHTHTSYTPYTHTYTPYTHTYTHNTHTYTSYLSHYMQLRTYRSNRYITR